MTVKRIVFWLVVNSNDISVLQKEARRMGLRIVPGSTHRVYGDYFSADVELDPSPKCTCGCHWKQRWAKRGKPCDWPALDEYVCADMSKGATLCNCINGEFRYSDEVVRRFGLSSNKP